MAEQARPNAIRYTQGDLVETDSFALEREQRSRDRTGVSQVERVMRGEEAAAPVAEERAALADQGVRFLHGPGLALRVAPGAVVGHGTVDVRARDKVTGRATFSVDVYPPGMLYTKVLRSPVPHAKVARIDTSKAEKLSGVAGVITYKDVPNVPRKALTGEPAFAGDPIAAVAAESEGIADDAIALIEVEYEKLPFVLDPREALKSGAPLVRTALKSNGTRDPQFSYERGDLAKGFADADLTVEVQIETSFEQHVAMEPHNSVAVWDRDLLTLYTGTQWPHGMAIPVAAELKIPQSSVRVVAGDTGGGWGDKTGRHGYHIVTALLAKKTGRPVRTAKTSFSRPVTTTRSSPAPSWG